MMESLDDIRKVGKKKHQGHQSNIFDYVSSDHLLDEDELYLFEEYEDESLILTDARIKKG